MGEMQREVQQLKDDVLEDFLRQQNSQARGAAIARRNARNREPDGEPNVMSRQEHIAQVFRTSDESISVLNPLDDELATDEFEG